VYKDAGRKVGQAQGTQHFQCRKEKDASTIGLKINRTKGLRLQGKNKKLGEHRNAGKKNLAKRRPAPEKEVLLQGYLVPERQVQNLFARGHQKAIM